MSEKPVVTSVTEALELAKRADWSLPVFIFRSVGRPMSPERLAEMQEKVRSFGAFNPTPAFFRPHTEDERLPPKWGEPLNPITVNRLGQG